MPTVVPAVASPVSVRLRGSRRLGPERGPGGRRRRPGRSGPQRGPHRRRGRAGLPDAASRASVIGGTGEPPRAVPRPALVGRRPGPAGDRRLPGQLRSGGEPAGRNRRSERRRPEGLRVRRSLRCRARGDHHDGGLRRPPARRRHAPCPHARQGPAGPPRLRSRRATSRGSGRSGAARRADRPAFAGTGARQPAAADRAMGDCGPRARIAGSPPARPRHAAAGSVSRQGQRRRPGPVPPNPRLGAPTVRWRGPG